MLLTMGNSSAIEPESPSRLQICRREILVSKAACGPSINPAFASCTSARRTISSSAGSVVSADIASANAAIEVLPSACFHTLPAAALSSWARSDCSSNKRQSPSNSFTMMSDRRALGCIRLTHSPGCRECSAQIVSNNEWRRLALIDVHASSSERQRSPQNSG